ncbi:MAG: transcription elongation factor GreA [Erysipelotrichaceae bacterium]
MADNKVYVTQEGLNELIREHENLIHVVRKQVIEELQEARAQGDLSENADYDAARDHQARVEARITELESMLANIEIIDEKSAMGGTVKLGSKVRILDLSENLEETFTIVGSVEADPLNGKLSNITPLAMAIMDCKAGDVVKVMGIDDPYEVKVIDVQ